MIPKAFMNRALLVTVCTAMMICTALATQSSKPLSEKEVTQKRIRTILKAAYIDVEFDEDGDLRIEDGGLKTFIRVDTKRKLITYFSIWSMKKSVSDVKKYRFVNTLNDEVIFVRFTVLRSTRLYCDHQLLYEGGIAPRTIVDNYRLFQKVTLGAVYAKDPEDIIGSD